MELFAAKQKSMVVVADLEMEASSFEVRHGSDRSSKQRRSLEQAPHARGPGDGIQIYHFEYRRLCRSESHRLDG